MTVLLHPGRPPRGNAVPDAGAWTRIQAPASQTTERGQPSQVRRAGFRERMREAGVRRDSSVL